jgi:hypothetical protein
VTSVFNDTDFRELLTSPPGAISYVLSATSFYLDISASRACDISGSAPSIFPRTTDLCSLGCPDDIRSILLLDIEGHRTLTLTSACSLTLPRPLRLLLLEQHQQPSAARLSGPSVAPDLDARAPSGSLPFLQLGSCLTDLCSRILPRDCLLLCSLGCCLEHNRASTICLTG